MKTIFISLLILGLAAGAFGLISLTGDNHMITERKDSPAHKAVPPIDTHIPVRIETATFALG